MQHRDQQLQNDRQHGVAPIEVVSNGGPHARPDFARETRRGIPEVIFAESKTTQQVIQIAQQFLDQSGRALVSRIASDVVDAVTQSLATMHAVQYPLAHALMLTVPEYVQTKSGGQVGIITAGTSDIPVAEEARFMAEAMGATVTSIYDVGVAGVHRLFDPLQALIHDGIDALVVAAGMDGALPSLVAGLVPVPVVGVPTPIGYGYGGEGQGALMAMLQSCSPGLAVVNIGNGIGAGAYAALIANRVAFARNAHHSHVEETNSTND